MLIPLLELASNTALEHDPASRERLQKLQGKCMTLTIKDLRQSISLCPKKEGVEFTAGVQDKVDVTLIAKLSALVKIGRDGLEDADLAPGDLEIQGDPIIGQRFAQLIAQLDIDWHGLLSERIGPAPASLLTTAATQARAAAQQGQQQLKVFVKALVQEDLDVVATVPDVDRVLEGVDELRAQVDKLELRLNRLIEKLS